MVQRRPWKRSGSEDSLIARKIEKMATDAKESNTVDRMRPPKRRWTRPTKVNESCWNTEKLSSEEEETIEDAENIEYDEVEWKNTREKLKRWQVFQMKKGFTENMLNTFLEKYIMNDETTHSLRSRFWWSRERDMEDRGVMMAIRNHGLVQSARLFQSYAPNPMQMMGNFPGTLAATTSTNFLRVNDMKLYNDLDMKMDQSDGLFMEMQSKQCSGLDLYRDLYYRCRPMMTRYNTIDIEMEQQALDMEMEMEKYNGLETDADKVDDSEGFLERAVTEAIKKKGLCARCMKHD